VLAYLASNERWADWEAMNAEDKAVIIAAIRTQGQLAAVQAWEQAKEQERKRAAERAKAAAKGQGRRR
jgi:hypothetical protein